MQPASWPMSMAPHRWNHLRRLASYGKSRETMFWSVAR
jgi:hypothetical protein